MQSNQKADKETDRPGRRPEVEKGKCRGEKKLRTSFLLGKIWFSIRGGWGGGGGAEGVRGTPQIAQGEEGDEMQARQDACKLKQSRGQAKQKEGSGSTFQGALGPPFGLALPRWR